jgi:hypothetical protein
MSKPLTLVAAVLLLAGCNAGPTEPAASSNGPEVSFLNNTKGCTIAPGKTAGTPGHDRVVVACERGQRPD